MDDDLNVIEVVKKTMVIWEKRGERGENEYVECPLCRYTNYMARTHKAERHDCFHCPYYQHFGCCDRNDTPYTRYRDATKPSMEHKAAWDAVAPLQCILDSLEEDEAVL